MGDWRTHGAETGGYYKCNKFQEDTPTNEVDRAQREIDRYLHYYKRYHAHHDSLKYAQKQLQQTEQRMVQMQNSSESRWADVEFLKDANQQLVECRRVLKYTYIYGYFLLPSAQNKMQREVFENHQLSLERFTENLSHLSEKPIEEMDRAAVVNQTRAMKQYVANVLDYVADGMVDG